MKIFILSYNRPDTHTTYFLLKKNNIDCKLVVYSEWFDRYVAGGVPVSDLIVSGSYEKLNSLAKHRNWVIENLVENGEWHIQASDDADEFFCVSSEYYDKEVLDVKKEVELFKNVYNTPFDFKNFDYIVEELKNKAEEKRAYYAGFAITKNHFFRPKKWSYSGLVDGRIVLIKKSELRYDENVYTIDDYQFSAENFYRYGIVVRNNFFCPMFKRYGVGGVGSQKDRFEKKKKDCEYLIDKYFGLFRWHKQRENKDAVDLSFNKINLEKLYFFQRAKK